MSPRCRLVVLGAPASGKSALIQRLLGREVTGTYDPTIEDIHRLSLIVENVPIRVQITDTAGKELVPGMMRKYCEEGDGFLIVYSVKSRRSLREAVRICNMLGPKPRILVATKCDADISAREVSVTEGRIVAAQLNCSFGETSSVADINVEEVFEEIVYQIRAVREMAKKQLRHPPCCFL